MWGCGEPNGLRRFARIILRLAPEGVVSGKAEQKAHTMAMELMRQRRRWANRQVRRVHSLPEIASRLCGFGRRRGGLRGLELNQGVCDRFVGRIRHHEDPCRLRQAQIVGLVFPLRCAEEQVEALAIAMQ